MNINVGTQEMEGAGERKWKGSSSEVFQRDAFQICAKRSRRKSRLYHGLVGLKLNPGFDLPGSALFTSPGE